MRAQQRGVTLVEVVMASGVAAIFLTSFMILFRVQQQNFQVASDELRLPVLGQELMSRVQGGSSSFATARAPTTAGLMGGFAVGTSYAQGTMVEPSRIQLPIITKPGVDFQMLEFVPSRGPGSPGTLFLTESNAGTIVRSELLSPPSAIASASFYSPNLVAGTTVPATHFSVLGAALVAASRVNGQPPQTFAFTQVRIIQYTRAAGTWLIQWPSTAAPRPYTFAPSQTFVLDGESSQAGYLTCMWPSVEGIPGAPQTQAVTTTSLSTVRRIAMHVAMATSPYTGLIALRDSLFLKN